MTGKKFRKKFGQKIWRKRGQEEDEEKGPASEARCPAPAWSDPEDRGDQLGRHRGQVHHPHHAQPGTYAIKL